MKRTFICLLAAFAVTTLPAAVAAQTALTEITASGTGSITMAPDMATIDAGIETNSANANDAISQNNAKYERVVTALENLGIARADITLAYYNVSFNPPPRVARPNSDERYGYTVSRNFTVKVGQIGKAGAVSDACTSAGATTINGVSFGLADSSAPRSRATAKAVADARANAETLAQAAGLRIISIKSIRLGGAEPPAPMPMMRMAAAPSPPTEFDQSNVNVSVTVSVVFLAQP